MSFFSKKHPSSSRHQDFSHIPDNMLYFDSACQTQRPRPVIAAMDEYYTSYNSCGGRVKYAWGERVDEEIKKTRELILSLLGKKGTEYTVSFTLNTTTGINQVLPQIPKGIYSEVLTTEVEHNSVFLPTIALSKRISAERRVLKRDHGNVLYDKDSLHAPIVVMNNVSNIDGQYCGNLKTFANDIHESGGILLVDAAQGFLQDQSLSDTAFDALFFSGHKVYGPSIGVIVIKNTLLKQLEITQLGGGMAQEVHKESFTLVEGEHLASLLELGLQDYAGIIGLRQALIWTKKHYRHEPIMEIAEQFRTWLKDQAHVHLISDAKTSVVTFYSDKVDSHALAIYCSNENIMARSGSFCCHYYITDVKQSPPLIRFSFGAHNTEQDAKRLVHVLQTLFANLS